MTSELCTRIYHISIFRASSVWQTNESLHNRLCGKEHFSVKAYRRVNLVPREWTKCPNTKLRSMVKLGLKRNQLWWSNSREL